MKERKPKKEKTRDANIIRNKEKKNKGKPRK